MADPWIRMRVALAQDPTVLSLGLSLGLSAGIPPEFPRRARRRIAVALLLETWGLFHVEADATGLLPGYSLADVDEHVGVTGWGQAMVDVGWLIVSSAGVTAYAFEDWIGSKKANQSKERERKRAKRACPPEVRRNSEGSPPDSSSSLSSSGSSSLSLSEGEPERDPTPKSPRRAKLARCTLDAQLAEVEFSELRSDIVEACRAWVGYRREAGHSPWGASTWRSNLRAAIQDPEDFCARIQQSIRNGWKGLFPVNKAGTNGQPPPPRMRTQDAFQRSLTELAQRLDEPDAPFFPSTPLRLTK